MSNEIEAAASMATGMVLAAAVEPEQGEAQEQQGQGKCLNCGTALNGSYCHACGQTAHVHRSIGAFLHDLLHSIFHFEGKIWRTLPMLFLHPGRLTRDYVHGHRARYVSPLALFLFCVFLMFASFNWLGAPFRHLNVKAAATDIAASRARTDQIKQESAKLDAMEAALKAKGGKDPALQQQIAAQQEALRGLSLEDSLATGLNKGIIQEGAKDIDTGNAAWDAKLKQALSNPDLLIYKLQSSAYKFSWLMIPISLPFLWLLFPFRRDVTAYDHLVFITYSLSFVTLLMVLLAIIEHVSFLSAYQDRILTIAVLAHMFVQLRGAYLLSVKGALWRTVLLAISALWVVGLFAIILFVMGAS
jgi:hypothetical protein